ncbi:MAG TPA: hypothetical protein PK152_07615 [Anaerolineales bacterium]|nr:hypothetical protein [Anaerolineae bacterium]HRJ57393.1 hypothetical protein [Anaerolineales bacterium]HRK88985.1 hypothetical protein [Anaerolineales bacterium]
MVSKELLEILRCPSCVREKEGLLTLHKDAWLICQDCGRKYPIVDDIPVMLIDEGDKWVNTAQDALPIPPPEK